ncbi:hypothetical protein [Providencia phage PSTCR2]|uniref:Uncharacterized protein n=1 Tax=Providencia phage PSTCR2 TaxID=2783544 RepID=A0A873WSZ6_9CAUD|nr:hypothetical protein [Providencia phage PSTCR2]
MKTICYPMNKQGYFNAVDYLTASHKLSVDELDAFLKFPHSDRNLLVSTIQRANSLRIQAANKANGFNNLK